MKKPIIMSLIMCLTWMCLSWAGSLPASAQINPFKNDRSGGQLSSTDLDLLGASISQLNRDPNVAVNSTTKWENPATGSNGTSTVTQLTSQHQQPCHLIHHEIFAEGKSPSRNYNLTWCRVAGNAWKIVK